MPGATTDDFEFSLNDLDESALFAEVETLLELKPLDTSSASSETEGENSHTKHRSKAATKNFLYRQRLKDEREELLCQQRELSQQLYQLQQQQAHSTVSDVSVWENQATRERKDRVHVEEEQKNLVLAICTQANFIAKFSKTIHTQSDIVASRGPEMDSDQCGGGQWMLKEQLDLLGKALVYMKATYPRFGDLHDTLAVAYNAVQKEFSMMKSVKKETVTFAIRNQFQSETLSPDKTNQNVREDAMSSPLRAKFTESSYRRAYRQKQKLQRKVLREKVQTLTAQLAKLKDKQKQAESESPLKPSATPVWKALANRFAQERLAAEQQQRQLLAALEERSALIDDIGVVFRNRTGEYVGFSGGIPKVNSMVWCDQPDAALYRTYLDQLDDIYAQTDFVFSTTAIPASTPAQGYYNPSASTPDDATYRELVGKELSPFPFQKVIQVIGHVKCLTSRSGCERFVGPGIAKNTTIVKFCVESLEVAGSFIQHAVVRRYEEADRVVVVWKKFTEGKGVFAGLCTEETNWCVIRRSPNAGTVMENINRYVPLVFRGANTSKTVLTQFETAVTAAREADGKTCDHKLSDFIFESALSV